MTTSVDDILNGPDYFYCEHYRARMKRQACIARQEKARHDPKEGKAPNLKMTGCMDCPQGLQIREEMNMASKRGICAGCGKERSLVAHGKCWKCNGYIYGTKKVSSDGGMEKKQHPDAEKREQLKTKIRARLAKKCAEKASASAIVIDKLPDPLPIAKIQGQAALLSPDPRIVLLDFTLPENYDLYEPWMKYCRSHRRTPGDQVMMVVEEILTKDGLL